MRLSSEGETKIASAEPAVAARPCQRGALASAARGQVGSRDAVPTICRMSVWAKDKQTLKHGSGASTSARSSSVAAGGCELSLRLPDVFIRIVVNEFRYQILQSGTCRSLRPGSPSPPKPLPAFGEPSTDLARATDHLGPASQLANARLASSLGTRVWRC